jgi:hypothetical protein
VLFQKVICENLKLGRREEIKLIFNRGMPCRRRVALFFTRTDNRLLRARRRGPNIGHRRHTSSAL